MKKPIKMIVSLALLCALTGCSAGRPPVAPQTCPAVYAETGNAKVMRDAEYAGKSSSAKISGAKGEYESFQIIIQSNDFDISTVSATVSDLKNGAHAISKENVTLYWQKYISVPIPTSIYPAGSYPDAILPLSTAVSYRENNVSRNANQAIWVELLIPPDAQAGTYASSVSVQLDKTTVLVPFTVQVYDFAISQRPHVRTAYGLWYDQLVSDASFGDADQGLHEELSLTLKENYYNDFLKYRINPNFFPDGLYGTGHEFAEAAKKYAATEKVSSFQIPTSTQTAVSEFIPAPHTTLNKSKTIEYIKALALSSTNEVNLVAKAYFYVANLIDEPSSEKYDLVREIDTFIKEAKQEVAELDIFGENDEVREAVLNIPHLVTGKAVPQLEGYVDTFCSTTEYLASPRYQYELEQQRENGVGVWWYTAVKPKAPMPSYHIDATMLEHRIMGWQMMDKQIEGNLYWSSTVFYKYNYSAGVYESRDVWNDPYAFPGAAGDGFLVYPGAKYGIDSFIPTLRLQAIRDGYEDYEYLWLLREAITEINEKYGAHIDFNEYIRRLSLRLYNGLIPNGDTELFAETRACLASILETYYNTGVLADMEIDLAENTANVTFYGENGTVVTAEDGKAYPISEHTAAVSRTLSLEAFSAYQVESHTLDLLFPLGVKTCIALSDADGLDGFASSKPSGLDTADIALSLTNDSPLSDATALRGVLTPNENARPDHTIYLRMTHLKQTDFTGVDTIEFSMYNRSGNILVIKPKLRNSTKAKTLEEIVLAPETETKVVIKLKSFADFDLSAVSAIDIAFDSFGNDYTPKTFYIGDVFVSQSV